MISAIPSDQLSTMHSYGYSYLSLNDYQSAIDYFQSLIDTDPNDFLSYQGLSIALAKQEKIQEAITILDKAIKIQPKYSSLYFFLSIYFNKINKKNEAIISLKKGIDLDPDNEFGKKLLGKFQLGIKELDYITPNIPIFWSKEKEKIVFGDTNLQNSFVFWSSGTPECIEPSCINVELPIEIFSDSIKDLPPFPDYSELSPSQRGYYLNWLQVGRSGSLTDNGYLFLYLYGLERRVLIDSKNEMEILYECIRLKRNYSSKTSFFAYISSFIGYILYKNIKQIKSSDIKVFYSNYDLIGPEELRVVLLWYNLKNKPIPGNIAFAVVNHYYIQPGKFKNNEFSIKKDFFLSTFKKIYPRGFQLKSLGYTYKLIYNPSNPYLKNQHEEKDFYQLTLSHNLLSKKEQYFPLKNIWDEILKINSIDEIDIVIKRMDVNADLTRRNRDTKTQSPNDLWDTILKKLEIDDPHSGAIIPIVELKPLILLLKKSSEIPSDVNGLQYFLNSQGYEVIPNLTNGEGLDNIGILFKDPLVEHSNSYKIALFFLEIGMLIIHADNKIDHEEMECLSKFIEIQFPLNRFDTDCIELFKKILSITPPNTIKIKRVLSGITDSKKKSIIASYILDLILSDNHIDKFEIDTMFQIFDWMQFSSHEGDLLLHNRLVNLNIELESNQTRTNDCEESEVQVTSQDNTCYCKGDVRTKKFISETNTVIETLNNLL